MSPERDGVYVLVNVVDAITPPCVRVDGPSLVTGMESYLSEEIKKKHNKELLQR